MTEDQVWEGIDESEGAYTGSVEGYFHPESLVIDILTEGFEPTSAEIR